MNPDMEYIRKGRLFQEKLWRSNQQVAICREKSTLFLWDVILVVRKCPEENGNKYLV